MLKKTMRSLGSIIMMRVVIVGCILLLLVTILSLVAFSGRTSTLPPAPAAFETTGLKINPPETDPGQELIITATVANTGDIRGGYMAELKVNDTTQQTMQVIVGAGETKAVTFAVVEDTPGIYEVVLGGLNGQFEVLKPATPPQSSNPTIDDPTTPSPSKPSKPSCCG